MDRTQFAAVSGAGLRPGEDASPMHVHQLPSAFVARWFGPGAGTFGRMGVIGEGSCFFHSLCVIGNVHDYLHQPPSVQSRIVADFRCAFKASFTVAKYGRLRAHVDERHASYQAEADAFCDIRVWADQAMIEHAADVLGMNLVFIDNQRGAAHCGVHGDQSLAAARSGAAFRQRTGVIMWVNFQHFEPIVRITDAARGRLQCIFDPDDATTGLHDTPMLRHLMRQYASSCGL